MAIGIILIDNEILREYNKHTEISMNYHTDSKYDIERAVNMIAVKSMDIRDNFKDICDKVFKGEPVVVSRPKNENVVIISESEYNDMLKAKRNAEYLESLDRSIQQLKEGKTVTKTMEELIVMENK